MAAPRFSCPYPGLRPFQQDEAELFFGREEQIDAMLARLEDNRFLAVVGASGAGKSSLVRAGLLPALEQGMFTGAEAGWHFVVLRPGNAPFASLAAALLEVAKAQPGASAVAPGYLEATLRSGPRGLEEGLRLLGLAGARRVLVLVDQFEEIFRFCRHQQGAEARALEEDRNDAAAFVSLLLATARLPQSVVHVVITMRSEFIGDCDAFHGLPEAVSASQFLVPRLTREQLREAIQGPLRLFGTTAEPALVNGVLNDAGTDPDQLPLMSNVLMRTWRLAVRQGAPRLELEHYRAVGGMAEALSRHADEAFDGLKTSRQQMIAERLFRCLSDRSAGGFLTRRLTNVQKVADVARATPDEVIDVVRVFQQESRNFIVSSPSGDLSAGTDLDISHEALLRQWGRLKGWVEKEAESATSYQQLVDGAARRKLRKAGLLRQPELGLALAWKRNETPSPAWAERYHRDAFPEAMRYLKWSGVWYVLSRGVFVAAVCVIGVFLFLQNQKLKTERNHAAEASTNAVNEWHRAETNRLAAETSRQANQDLLVKSLLRTIGLGRPNETGGMERPEYESLWDLAELRQEDFRIRREFGRRALADEDALTRVKRRFPETIHALVCLNEERAKEVTQLSLQLCSVPSASRSGLASTLTWMWFAEAPRAHQERIIAAFTSATNSDLHSILASVIGWASANASPEIATVVTQGLLEALKNETNASMRLRLFNAMGSAAGRASKDMASQATEAMMEAFGKGSELQRSEMFDALGCAAANASSQTASEATKALLGTVQRSTFAPYRGRSADALAGAATNASPEMAAAAAKALSGALQAETDGYQCSLLAGALARVAAITPIETKSEATRALIGAFRKSAGGTWRNDVARNMVFLAANAPVDIAVEAAAALRNAFQQETGSYDRVRLAGALADMLGEAPPETASRLKIVLLDGLWKPEEENGRSELLAAFVNWPGGLSVPTASALTEVMVEALGKETNANRRSQLTYALRNVVGKASNEKASSATKALLTAFEHETSGYWDNELADALGSAAAGSSTETASEAATVLLGALQREALTYRSTDLAHALGFAASGSSPEMATRATAALLDALARETNAEGRIPFVSAAARASRSATAEVAWTAVTNLLTVADGGAHTELFEPLGQAVQALSRDRADRVGRTILGWYWTNAAAVRGPELEFALLSIAKKTSPEVGGACLEILLGCWDAHEARFQNSELIALAEHLHPQQIVELLKYPTSVGPVRAELLQALEKQTGRQFHGDIWQVAAQADALGLDIDSPPKRPQRPPWLDAKPALHQ